MDVAKANYDLGVRDNRTPEELANLKTLLTGEERKREVLRNRLKLVKQATSHEASNIAKTVLFRRPPTITIPATYVNGNPPYVPLFAISVYDLDGLVNLNGTTPFGEPQLHDHWGVQPHDSYFLWTGNNSDRVDGRQFTNGDGRWFEDAPIEIPLGQTWYAGSNLKNSDWFLSDRISRYESAYRMQSLGETAASPVPSGFRPRGGTVWIDGRVHSTGFEFFRGMPVSFDVDMNGNGLIDEGFLGTRPQVIARSRVAPNGLGFLPALRGSRLRYDSSGTRVRVARSRSEPVLTFSTSELSGFDVDYGLVGQEFISPQFDGYLIDQDSDGLLIDDSRSLMTDVTRLNRQIPVSHYYSMLIEDQQSDEERYGKVPILYRSNNDPNVALDDLMQFPVFKEELYDDFDLPREFLTYNRSGLGIDGEGNLQGLSRRRYASQFAPFRRLPAGLRFGRSVSSQPELVELPIQRPGVLQNILSYAPGMQTSAADLLAVLDTESEPANKPVRGQIDDAARRLIEKARTSGWETVAVLDARNAPEVTLSCNGAGELRIERRTVDGLLEQVISDGTSLQHLYPELGIGAKRTVTRFHRKTLLSMTPWLLPPVEDLAIGCDIHHVSKSTIRITRVKTPESDNQTTDDAKSAERFELAVELVFSDDGQLAERRLVKLLAKPEPTEQVLSRHIYEASGNIRILNKDDELISEVKLQRKTITDPTETPSTDGLVMLPLPFRSADSYSLTLPAQPASQQRQR
jgi:hypothetical protein